MPLKEADAVLINFNESIKDNYSNSNLYTSLTVYHPNFGETLINAYDLLELARIVTKAQIEHLKKTTTAIQGSGTFDDPFHLQSPEEWLLAAIKYDPENAAQHTFYQISDQKIDVNKKRMASSQHNSLASEPHIEGTTRQIFSHLLNPANASKIPSLLPTIPAAENSTNFLQNVVSSVIPFTLLFAQTAQAKFISPDTQWKEPPYSELSDEHRKSTQFARLYADKVTEINEDQVDKMLSGFDSQKISDSDISFSKFPSIASDILARFETHFVKTPHYETSKEDYEKFKTSFSTIFPLFENLTKQDTPASLFKKITDVLLINPELAKVPVFNQFINFLAPGAKPLLQTLSKHIVATKVSESKLKVIEDISHTSAILEIRQILTGDKVLANASLPVSIAALFFSETGRYPLSFLATQMLLDLVQAQFHCPDLSETFSLTNLMANPKVRTSFVDGYGYLYTDDESQERDKLKQKYLDALYRDDPQKDFKINRLNSNQKASQTSGQKTNKETKRLTNQNNKINREIKKYIPGNITQNVCGYHPMVQGDSYLKTKHLNLESEFSELTDLGLVEQKIASVMLQWLFFQLSANHIKAKLHRNFFDRTPKQSLEASRKKDNFLTLEVWPLFEKRIKNMEPLNCHKTALHWAAINADAEEASLLLAAGTSFDCVDNNERTPWDFASQSDNTLLKELFLNRILEMTLSEFFSPQATTNSFIQSNKVIISDPETETPRIKNENEMEIAKKISLDEAQKEGKIGPRSISGWELKDVKDEGNCFYEAVADQLRLINHSFLHTVPEGTEVHDSLRLLIQGENFRDKEWVVDDPTFEKVIKELDIILAIVDTRIPQAGFVCRYINEAGEMIINTNGDQPVPNRMIVKIAATGNHFLSVLNHPYLSVGAYREAYNQIGNQLNEEVRGPEDLTTQRLVFSPPRPI